MVLILWLMYCHVRRVPKGARKSRIYFVFQGLDSPWIETKSLKVLESVAECLWICLSSDVHCITASRCSYVNLLYNVIVTWKFVVARCAYLHHTCAVVLVAALKFCSRLASRWNSLDDDDDDNGTVLILENSKCGAWKSQSVVLRVEWEPCLLYWVSGT